MSKKTMQALDPVRRRRAAIMTLSEVLIDEQLMRAMWMIEEKDQSANKYAFIGFVGVTAELLGINNHIVTKLYRNLNKNIELTDQALPDDPMPKMLEYRAKNKGNTAASAKKNFNASKKIKATPEMAVFVTLLSKILTESGYPSDDTFNLFKILFKEEIARNRLKEVSRKHIISWIDTLNIKVFTRNIAAGELIIMVQSLYITLCKLFGQTKADEIMEQATNHASNLQAAQSFSPKNFL